MFSLHQCGNAALVNYHRSESFAFINITWSGAFEQGGTRIFLAPLGRQWRFSRQEGTAPWQNGSLWRSDVQRAQRLETGGVFINGYPASNARIPVGGVRKSGDGRELSHFGLRELTDAQAVWAKEVD